MNASLDAAFASPPASCRGATTFAALNMVFSTVSQYFESSRLEFCTPPPQAQMVEHTEQLERTRDALDAANERMAAMEADVQLTLDEVTATVTGLSLFLFLR
jgi:hypothetical protein